MKNKLIVFDQVNIVQIVQLLEKIVHILKKT